MDKTSAAFFVAHSESETSLVRWSRVVLAQERKLRAPIYDRRYERYPEDFHGAMSRAQQRAEKIHRRFVAPKVEARRRFLADYVAGWEKRGSGKVS